MAQYLKNEATYFKHGITLTGDGLGNQGVFSVTGFSGFDRKAKIAIANVLVYVDTTQYTQNGPFDNFKVKISGDDFDTYIATPPTVEEETMYLLPIKRVYDFISDKANAYNSYVNENGIPEVNTPEEKSVEWQSIKDYDYLKDIVDDPQFINN